MRASGSNTAFGRLPWARAPAVAEFRPEPRLDVRDVVQNPDVDKPLFEKRTEPAGAAPIEVSFGPFRLLPTQFLLLEGDKPVPLGSRALAVLIVLLERRGELVSKQELMARVWPDVFVEPANLSVQFTALRRALRDGQKGNRFSSTSVGAATASSPQPRYWNTRTEPKSRWHAPRTKVLARADIAFRRSVQSLAPPRGSLRTPRPAETLSEGETSMWRRKNVNEQD
jgi:hypothetical protein